MKTLKELITRSLLIFPLLASLSSSLPGQTVSTNDIVVYKKTSTGYVLVPLTPSANKVLGFNGSSVFGLQTAGAAWGAITGTLSSQTDLQSALDAKLSTAGTLALGGFGAITGTVPLANGGLGADVSASSGVPNFSGGSVTFSSTTGSSAIVRSSGPSTSGDWTNSGTLSFTGTGTTSGLLQFTTHASNPTTTPATGFWLYANTDGNFTIRRTDGFARSLSWGTLTADRAVTFPDSDITVVGTSQTQTITNKTISGASNTLSNIGNSSLTNSSITINGTSVSLGGSISVSASPAGSDTQVQFNDGGSAFGASSGLTFDKTNKALTLGGATITTSNPVISATQTWNAGGVTFTGIKLNVTDTASASGSLLGDFQIGGTSKVQIIKDGSVNWPYTGDLRFLTAGLSGSSQIRFWWRQASAYFVLEDGNGNAFFRAGRDTNGGVSIQSQLGFGASDGAISPDTYLVRTAANTLALKNSTTQQKLQVYGTTTGSKYAELTHNGTNMILTDSNSGAIWRTGAGSPEGSITAPVGSLYTRTDGGASTTLYVKESGSGNTGWVAK